MATDDIARALAIKAIQGGGGGTNVVANPTLAGTEADLTGLQVGDTKYAIPAGSGTTTLYQHYITLSSKLAVTTERLSIGIVLIRKTNTAITTLNAIKNIIGNKGIWAYGHIYTPSTGIDGFVTQVYFDSEDNAFTVSYNRLSGNPTQAVYNDLTVSDKVIPIN